MNEQCYPENIEEIKKFAEMINIDVKYLLGEKYEDRLALDFVESLPDNIQFNVGGDLYLYSVQSLSDNTVFNVGGCLDLRSVKSLPANILFNVRRKIYLPTKHKVKVLWS